MGNYVVGSGDTLSGIAARYGLSLGALESANPQISNPNAIFVGQTVHIPDSYSPAAPAAPVNLGGGGNGARYTVRSGDSLSAIGARFGVSYQAIAQANGIANPNSIYPGQVLTIPGAGGGVAAPAAATSARYTVQSGDSLSAIGARFGVSYQAIAQANGIADPNTIYPGQALTIPGAQGGGVAAPPAAASARYTVQSGDSLSSIGARFGVSYQAIAQANGISNPNVIYPGQVITIPGAQGGGVAAPPPPAAGASYTVQSGDSLSSIGARFGVSYVAIAEANGITNPNVIYPGQVLRIPGATGNGGGVLLSANPPGWTPGGGRLYGADTSGWQSDATFQQSIAGTAWTVIKATEGTGFTDATFPSRWAELGQRVASGQMKLRMAYAFLHAGNGAGQAQHFLNSVGIHGPLPAGTRLALDWEADALSDPQGLRDAASYIAQVTGTWPLIYTSGSQVGRARAAVPEAPIWDAQWGGSVPTDVPFVQYSDGPGYDHDLFNGDINALNKFAGWS